MKAGEPGFQPQQRDQPQELDRSRVLLSEDASERSVTGKTPAPSPRDFDMERVLDAAFPPRTELFIDDNCN